MDSENWRKMLVSKSFGTRSVDLAKAVAKMAQLMCLMTCNKEREIWRLSLHVACTLISLDKSPGVRQIRIGEVLRRIVGKVVMKALKSVILQAVGNP